MPRLNTIIFASEWKGKKGIDLPCRKVFVAWFREIVENEDSTFMPNEFSSHLQIKYSDDRLSLIHGHYGDNAEEVFHEYQNRTF